MGDGSAGDWSRVTIITEVFSDNRSILLLDPCLIVFAISSRAIKLDALLFTLFQG
jgi:hypothetical protein